MITLPQWFYRRTARGERFLYRSAAVMLGLLIISQLLMANSRIRTLLSRVDTLEGIPYQGQLFPE